MENSIKHSNCPVCSSKSFYEMPGYEKAYLNRCRKCSLVFSSRIPLQEELQMCYANYGQKEYLSPITLKRFDELLNLFEKYRKTNRILDMGCGYGAFLVVAKKKGWDVYGTEFSDKAIEIAEAKGIKVAKAGFSVKDFEPGYFDVITASEVIEHLPDPCKAIADVRSGLRKGGVVYFTTPNFDSLLRYRLGPEYNIIDHPEHLSYFNKRSLHQCLNKNGFRKEFLKCHGFSVTRLKASQKTYKKHIIAANTRDEKIRNTFEKNNFNQFVKKSLNSLLSASGLGDTLKALYVKI